ncbi:hypothetical protein CR513_12232, partial [Mucuna pruriens]
MEAKDDSPVKEVTNIAGAGGMTWSGRVYTPENLRKEGLVPKKTTEIPKDTPKGKEAKEFLKLFQYSEYELLEQMNKTPAHKLCSVNSQLRTSSVVVRAFDGSKREVMGEITLPIYVGPTMFNIVFQVMDICPAYNCLLGRS